MCILLSLNFNSSDISKFLITKDRFFVVSSYFGFDDVPVVRHMEDDYYETTERQCVENLDFIVAITDNLEQAMSLRDIEIEQYNEKLKENDLSEEYGYTRYNVFVYNESEELFEVVQ